MEQTQWYQLSEEEVFKKLEVTPNGLSGEEAKARLTRYGYNEIVLKGKSSFSRLLDQFRSPLVWILLIASAVTSVMSLFGFEDMWSDTAVIMGVVILNVILGFQQEGKADAALEALKKMAVSRCTVFRDGTEIIIPSRELVPGDIVILDGGDKVPADLRLFYTKDAYTDEATLTGESTPVEKTCDPLKRRDVSPADQQCVAFSGTFLTRGIAKGIVTETGDRTEFGKIARLMKQTHTVQTPLQKKIASFTTILVIGITGIGVINFIIGSIFHQDLLHMFMVSVAIIVAGMPEMLPMIVTGVLALAATTMAKRNALIRRLTAAETLGSTTVICSDKTGTLTKNEMTVQRIYAGDQIYHVTGVGYDPAGEIFPEGTEQTIDLLGSVELTETLKAGYHCNNASLYTEDGKYHIIGDPTEAALVVSAMKANINNQTKKIDEIPFDPELRYMATLHQNADENVIYIKGSPERIFNMCKWQLVNGEKIPLDRDKIVRQANHFASEALRVLGLAYKTVSSDNTYLNHDDMIDMVFLGLQGMIDPPRQEAIEAIAKCKTAGIRTVMITGDHVLTATAIARQLGIIHEKDDDALRGEDLSRMSDSDLFNTVDRISVYARVAPEHKLRIAQQLQKRRHVVAMTGDGVNDALALKAADIGIAMGITGTEVSKEAASMVLTDDNFASIVAAVEEGRHAWKNLEKAILYTLPTNGGQMALLIIAILLSPFIPLFAIRLPLEPIHILWVNLADSIFLTIPLLFEPKEKGLLNEKPRDPRVKIANRLFFIRVGLVSTAMAITGFFVFWFFGQPSLSNGNANLGQAQTATFAAIQLLHLGFLVTARSVYESAFTFSPFSNRWVLLGMVMTIFTQLLIIYVPFLQTIFKTEALPVEWWFMLSLCLLPGFVLVELEKLIRKRLKRKNVHEGF